MEKKEKEKMMMKLLHLLNLDNYLLTQEFLLKSLMKLSIR